MAAATNKRNNFNLDSATESNIRDSQAIVLEEMKKAGYLQSITIEYNSNGTIKKIERNFDLKNVLTLGVFTVIGGVTIYYVGPANVIEAAKAALVVAEAAQKISAMLPSNRVQEKPTQWGAVKKEERTHNVL